MANSFPRPLAKRSAAIAIGNMIGNTASIYGSYMYPSSTSPRYIPGGTANTVVCLSVAVLALALRFVHIRENRKLETLEIADGEGGLAGDGGAGGADAAAAAVRDRRAVGFRYVY